MPKLKEMLEPFKTIEDFKILYTVCAEASLDIQGDPVTHHLESYLLLTSKHKFHFSIQSQSILKQNFCFDVNER